MSRPVSRRRHRTPAAAAALLLALLVGARLWFVPSQSEQSTPDVLSEKTYTVQRVVDGDTLLLTNRARVRLIGVDTPESVKPDHPIEPFGPEASEFTKQFIGEKPVQLRLDHERVDQHDRWLAYVYVDGKMLNEALLRAGLAKAHTKYHYAEPMKRLFRAAEAEARKNRRGIWSGTSPSGQQKRYPAR